MKRRKQEAGQALVETALVMPMLLTMLTAILTLGHLFASQLVVTNASREGARGGALGQSTATITQTIQQQLDAANLGETVTVTVEGEGDPSGSAITVIVSYPLVPIVPVPGLPNPFPLEATTIMRIE